MWDEPQFRDNVAVERVSERSGHRPGQTLLWGSYEIAYVAYDQAGNTATCSFQVYVLCKNSSFWVDSILNMKDTMTSQKIPQYNKTGWQLFGSNTIIR